MSHWLSRLPPTTRCGIVCAVAWLIVALISGDHGIDLLAFAAWWTFVCVVGIGIGSRIREAAA